MMKTRPRYSMDRRAALKTLGFSVASGGWLLGCFSSNGSGGVDAATGADAPRTDAAVDAAVDASSGGACATIASETPGPYPDLDGMISNATFERSNIAETQTSTPLTLTLTVQDSANACAPIAGARVMIWHCTKDGIYSEYKNSMNAGDTAATYLRGWQTTDANGQVTFQTIYPGWYLPRVTHIHVEVYSPSDLTTPKKVTQLGFPDAVNTAVQSQSTYKSGQTNSVTNDTDQVFGGTATTTGDGDGGGHVHQIASTIGSVAAGYTATLAIGLTGYTA